MADVEDHLYTFETICDVVRNVLDQPLDDWQAAELTRKAIIDVCPDAVSDYSGGCEVA